MFTIEPTDGLIHLGKQGENLARRIYFEEPSKWLSEFGAGTCELLHQRDIDNVPYLVPLKNEDGKFYWEVLDSDTSFAGVGKCELIYSVDDVIVKTSTWKTLISKCLEGACENPPEAIQPWVNKVIGAARKVETATTHPPVIDENGYWNVWDFETQEYVNSGVCAKGKNGTDGHTPIKGTDYYTPEEKQELVDEIADTVTDDIETALDNIIAIQNTLIGGDSV